MTSDTNFNGYPRDGRVYLVHALSARGGFYVCNGEPIYAVKVGRPTRNSSAVETERLQLRLGVRLRVAEGDHFTETQQFDMIRLISFQDDKELTAFVDLCIMHAEGSTALSFEEFFYSLNDLFRPLRGQRFINAMGLYGELALIDAVRKSGIGLDFTRYWQLAGEESKYDFALEACNIEVKSASAQKLSVHIKHAQFFNEDTNYLAVVLLERVPNGETLEQLAARLAKYENCFTDFRSQAELTKQLFRVDEKGLKTAYLVRGIRCYPAKSIDFFKDIPDRIYDLSYRLNLADLAWDKLNETLNKALAQ